MGTIMSSTPAQTDDPNITFSITYHKYPCMPHQVEATHIINPVSTILDFWTWYFQANVISIMIDQCYWKSQIDWQHVRVRLCEVSWKLFEEIEDYDPLKVVPFLDHPIHKCSYFPPNSKVQIPVFIPLYYLKRVHYWEMMGWTVIDMDWEPQFQQSLVYDLKMTLSSWIMSWLSVSGRGNFIQNSYEKHYVLQCVNLSIAILKKTAFMVAIYITLELGLFILTGEEFNHSSYYGALYYITPLNSTIYGIEILCQTAPHHGEL